MTEQEYRRDERIANSDLGYIAKSMTHYRSYKENGTEETDAMLLGTLFHQKLLEPKKQMDVAFESEYAEMYPHNIVEGKIKSRVKKEYQMWKKSTSGRILKIEDEQILNEMIKNFNELDFVKELRKDEEKGYWEISTERNFFFEQYGVECKSRLDLVAVSDEKKHILVIDLKTTSLCVGDEIQKKINNFEYYRQAAFYKNAVMAHYPGYTVDFLFIFAEKTAPYGCRVVDIDDKYLELGNIRIEEILTKYKNEKDLPETLPVYGNETLELTPPNWMLYKAKIQDSSSFSLRKGKKK